MSKKLQEIKLSQWAKDNDIKYKEAWNLYNAGAFPAKTKVSDKGRISVMVEAKASQNNNPIAIPQLVGKEERQEMTASRRNKAATSTPTDQFYQIDSGILPFNHKTHAIYGSLINMHDIAILCMKAYFNFSDVRNIIDVMTEFSTNKIYLRGGNKKAQDFFYNWFESINLLGFEDKFFRECYRGSNVFPYRFDAKLNDINKKELNSTFGAKLNGDVKIPIKYIILNPADINIQGGALFSNVTLYKQLNNYEVARLQSPKTEEDKALFNNLPPEVKKNIKEASGDYLLPLDPSLVYAIFFKKQDYEGMAVPALYAVLKDINFKAELKSIDLAISRTMHNFVLLIKMGYEDKQGNYVFNQDAANAMKQIFESETVGKTLVGDFTTEVEFKIPSVGDFLNPQKYQIVNEDIKNGLNSIMTGSSDSKFANQYIQVQLFIQRLNQARELFLTEFLKPEIKRIHELMGFKGKAPEPFFEDIDLKDTAEFDRIVTRLTEIGVLTAPEALNALETGRLPNKEESEEAQEEYRKLRDKGYYEPIMGGPNSQLTLQKETQKGQEKILEKTHEHDDKQKSKDRKHAADNPPAVAPQIHINAPKIKQQAGKPTGPAGKNSKTRKSTPMKASEEFYSLSKLKDNYILLSKIDEQLEKTLLKKHKIKELNATQKEVKDGILEIIISNNESKDWESSIEKYIENPIHDNTERLAEIDNIACVHSLGNFAAAMLLASKKDE